MSQGLSSHKLTSHLRSASSPKAAEAARLLLSDMWASKELQSVLRQVRASTSIHILTTPFPHLSCTKVPADWEGRERLVYLTKQGKADSRGQSGADLSISECEQGSDKKIYLQLSCRWGSGENVRETQRENT